MKLSKKEKKIYTLVLSFSCFLVLFALYQSMYTNSSRNLRKLIESSVVVERCDKASEDLNSKYKNLINNMEDLGNFNDKIISSDKLDKYQDVLKEIIEDGEYGKIKKYLPRILVYLIIAIIDIIFIIFWILFCCYACKNVEKQNRIGCGAKCSFIIFFIICLAVLIFSVIGIIYSPYVFQGLNGLACSINKLVFHFLEGNIDNNPEFKWIGLTNIKENITNLNFNNRYSNAIQIVDSTITTFEDINNKTLDDLEKIMENIDCVNKYSSFLLFGGVAIFNLLGLLSMFFLFVCQCKCFSCFFHLFWNIEIIFIIVTFCLSSVLGSFSVVSKDISEILINQIKPENLKEPENAFIFNFTEIHEEIDICINREGNLSSHLFKENEDYYFQEMEEKMEKGIQPVNKTMLMDWYNCSFFKMDYQIIVGELEDTITKRFYFISLIFIIVDVAGIISIFFGITVYNSQKGYLPPSENEVKVNNNKYPNNRIDLSTENLKRQNNEFVFSKK